MSTMMAPPTLIPPGWGVVKNPLTGHQMIARHLPNGLYATFAVETYTTLADGPPLERPGIYRRLVLSRRDRYPRWNEMRDTVRDCGRRDRSRDVFMILPPDKDYVNVAKNAFHWFQEVR